MRVARRFDGSLLAGVCRATRVEERDPLIPLDQPLEAARSLCPECLGEADGGYAVEGGHVVLRRTCAEHGTIASEFWENPDHYRRVRAVDERAHENGASCCGPGETCTEGPGPKRCVAVLPITDGCNLECPYCFAASGPGGTHRSFDEVDGMLHAAVAESGPMPLQLSGGEPTIHPDLLPIVRKARGLGYRHIELNTNGIVVANREGFARALREAGVSTLYLQFDGTGADAHDATRGADLGDVKRRAIERAREAGLTVVLAATIVRGRNDTELGNILEFALKNRDVVRGVNFQAVRHFGRYAEDTGHLSLDRIARLLAEQTGYLEPQDLQPFPCCSAVCYLATAILPTPDGAIPLTRFIREADFLEALNGVNERQYMEVLAGTPEAVEVLNDALCACGIEATDLVGKVLEQTLFVSVTGFMDAHTVDVDRMDRCCVQVITREGRLAPFCGYYLTDASGAYAWRDRHVPEDRGLPAGPIVLGVVGDD